MNPEPMTAQERAAAILLTQTLQLLHGADPRGVSRILNRYGMRPQEALDACRALLPIVRAMAGGLLHDHAREVPGGE